MENENTSILNWDYIVKASQRIFEKITKTRLKIVAKSGKTHATLPLIVAIIITCILPIFAIASIMLAILLNINIVVDHQMKDAENLQN